MLQVFAVAVMVIPSDTVIAPVGAAGYPASLIGVFVFGIYLANVLFGFHNPQRQSHPIQGVLCLLWLAVLGSYILMDRGMLTGIELASADRMLIRFAVITGVALVAAEWLGSLHDVMRVVRAICWAGAICGFIAMLQYWLSLDLAQFLRQLPGFVPNHDNPAIVARGSLNRASGTAITAIELGVVSGMLIPLAVCLGMYDRDKGLRKRWGPLALIGLGVATSVSRSAILTILVALIVLVVLLPPRPRLAVLCGLPFALVAIFMSAHGLIGTLTGFFSGAGTDPSIRYRTHDYPLAEELWRQAPWFGKGPGTYIANNSLNIFDNQYLASAVEIGLVGLLALIVYLSVPTFVVLVARMRTADPDLRLLCAALAASSLPALAASLTFDSMSFPMFVNLYALNIGLVGACWRLAKAERRNGGGTAPAGPPVPTRFELLPPDRSRPRRAVS